MKYIVNLLAATILFTLLVTGAFAQTDGQVISVTKGTWSILVMDASYNPKLHGPDSSFYLSPDTILQWKVIHDTLKIVTPPVTTVQHDTMWQCGPTNANWCPTKPVVVVTPPPPPTLVTIFTTQTLPTTNGNDFNGGGTTIKGITVGAKFRSTVTGYVKGVRFYKTIGNTGVHTGLLYSSTGSVLAQGTFTSETASGWQTLTFTSEVAILANTTYVAAESSADGNYSQTLNGFTTAINNSPLIGLADGTDGVNGVYSYGVNTFPKTGFSKSNYWTDAVFSVTK